MDIKARFEEKFVPEPNTGCWLWMTACFNTGYGLFWSGRSIGAHRMAYELYVGPIPPGLFVLHKCDVRACVNPNHLFLGTQADNVADMDRKGRRSAASGDRNGSRTRPDRLARGGANFQAKLTEQQAREIRADKGALLRELAARYGISESSVSLIRRGINWAHLT